MATGKTQLTALALDAQSVLREHRANLATLLEDLDDSIRMNAHKDTP